MRHKVQGRKFGRRADQRNAMMSNLVRSLIINEKIETTLAKAKEMRSYTEKLITHAKKGTLNNRRQTLKFITDKGVIKKLFTDISEKYKERPGGYTRVTKIGFRRGDAAEMAIIELV
jgi:large subunit ribosomal protein L17